MKVSTPWLAFGIVGGVLAGKFVFSLAGPERFARGIGAKLDDLFAGSDAGAAIDDEVDPLDPTRGGPTVLPTVIV